MAQRSSEHGVFAIERVYAASPTQVFTAWSDPAAKSKWFGTPDLALDFNILLAQPLLPFLHITLLDGKSHMGGSFTIVRWK